MKNYVAKIENSNIEVMFTADSFYTALTKGRSEFGKQALEALQSAGLERAYYNHSLRWNVEEVK